jgi:hypothetical protein
MIFIWPFLSEISLGHHHFNRKPFIKVVSYFSLITLSALAFLQLFGSQLVSILFGVDYDFISIRNVGMLSVLFKYFMLIITAVILYFTVLRSYVAIWLSLLASGILFMFSELFNKQTSVSSALIGLDIIAGILSIICVVLLFTTPSNKARP